MARNSSRSPYRVRLNMDTSDMYVDEQLSLYDNDDNASEMHLCPTNPLGPLPFESSPRRFQMFESDGHDDDDLGFHAPDEHRKTANDAVANAPKQLRIFHSLSSGLGSTENSLDDEYMQEFFNIDTHDQLPSTSAIGTLLRAKIKTDASSATPTSTRMITPKRSKSPLCDVMRCSPKRFRGAEYDKENRNDTLNACFGGIRRKSPARLVTFGGTSVGGGPPLRKSMSLNDAQIMTALTRSESVDLPDLIGDFSKPYALPLLKGRHTDLKSISSDTLARLINGDFAASVDRFTIIDCRYPYEYEGGHIVGAKNLYTQLQIVDEFLQASKRCNAPLRSILIFHCEFSSERGPKLSRFLRNKDRAQNTSAYPALDYPELYLLHNGYKEFYETHAELCEPRAYRPMLAPDYNESYRHFRAKSKSWNADAVGGGLTTPATKITHSKSRSLCFK